MGRLCSIRVLACWMVFSSVLQAQQYVFRSFRQAEGLKNLAIKAMTTDRSGFLWLATENGVYRYLGSGFVRYGPEQGIAELNIRDLISDLDGNIWASTDKNLYRWDGQRFHPVGRDPIPVESQRRMVVEDTRHLLIVKNGRVFRLEHDAEGKMLTFLPVFSSRMLASLPDMAHVISLSVVHDSQGGVRVWAGCGNNLCSWLDGVDGNLAQPRPGGVTEWGKDKGIPKDYWQSVFLDRSGTLWAGSRSHVAAMPRDSSRFVDRAIPGSAPDNNFGHAPLIEDREGRILTPTDKGIARWEGDGWRIIGKANGLERASRILSLVFDAAGDLWIGSRGDGLYQWVGYADWESWGEQQGLPSIGIWAIAPLNADRLLVGTERGPAWIDPRTGAAGSLSALQPWPFGQARGFSVERDGSLSVATLSGIILRLDPRTGRTQQTAKITETIYRAAADSSRRLFLETAHGLYLRDAGALNSAPHRIAAVDALIGGSTEFFDSCESPGGADWLAAGSRLLRLKNGQWSAPDIEGISPQGGNLWALSCARDETLWVVNSREEIWRLTPQGNRLQAWKLEPPPELRAVDLLAILADHRGWVWLGTDQGILVWNGQNWRHLTQESGLIWNDVNQGMLQEASDGSLWIGTTGGVSHLLHPERVFDPIPLTVSLTAFQRGETSYLGANQITIPWGGPPLHFRISSSTMRNRSELTYKFQMAGLLKGWVTSENGVVNFSSLTPGSYTFIAMACNPGFDACSDPVQVDIRILPPWWRTYWFYGLCSLAIIAILFGGVHLYDRQLRARSRELERLVSERTRELEASREQLRIQATHDGLTGMLNRTAILRILAAEMDRARRESRTVVIALIDLDHFKRINDSNGHRAGDDALRWFAAAVGAAIRPYDHAGRYGGEEFLLVLTELPRDSAVQRLASLHAAISNLEICELGAQFTLNCSMGATVYDPSGHAGSVESLLAIADQALYAAKAEGRNRVVFREPAL
jgi:diguanylate cyclase (GGDEF)-like protein